MRVNGHPGDRINRQTSKSVINGTTFNHITEILLCVNLVTKHTYIAKGTYVSAKS